MYKAPTNQFRAWNLKTTIQNVLHKYLHAYKIQLQHEIKPADCPKCFIFPNELLDNNDSETNYLLQVKFSKEATF